MHLTVFAVALALIAPSAFAAPLIKRDINGYELAGCYSDGTIAYHRALNKASFIDPENMTVDLCTAFCAEKGYTLAGVEYSFECYCGNKIEFGNKAIEAERCSMPCAGEATQICGAGNALSVWSSAGEPVVQNPAPQTEGLPEGCVYVGCHQDSPEERALSFGIGYEGGLTPAVCVEACLAAGYPFSGVEYGQQCYCGDKVLYGAADPAKCYFPCEGDDSYFCGGDYNLNLYSCPVPEPPTTTDSPVEPTEEVSPTAEPTVEPTAEPTAAQEPSASEPAAESSVELELPTATIPIEPTASTVPQRK